MSAIGTVLSLGASAMSGGIFGLVGNLAGRVFSYLDKRQEYAFKKEQWGHELALQQLQMQARKEETEQEVKLADVSGSWAGLNASIRADAELAGRSYSWVDASKSMVRPFLTLMLVTFVCVRMSSMNQGPQLDLMVEEVLALTGMAVAWWFGDRAPSIVGRKR